MVGKIYRMGFFTLSRARLAAVLACLFLGVSSGSAAEFFTFDGRDPGPTPFAVSAFTSSFSAFDEGTVSGTFACNAVTPCSGFAFQIIAVIEPTDVNAD